MSKTYTVAVVGATGAVGLEMIATLERRNFPVGKLRLFASERSVGKKLPFRGEQIPVELLTKDVFRGIDFALFSAGASRSKEYAPAAVEAGCIVIDNSS
ncbi:MAG: aspartate-semialdehyde dehydrogenase, partial [Planctomycetota bacterium]|nr:aspartate-semialdehyde dehydrogenase [Planctomycetota bacterium]